MRFITRTGLCDHGGWKAPWYTLWSWSPRKAAGVTTSESEGREPGALMSQDRRWNPAWRYSEFLFVVNKQWVAGSQIYEWSSVPYLMLNLWLWLQNLQPCGLSPTMGHKNWSPIYWYVIFPFYFWLLEIVFLSFKPNYLSEIYPCVFIFTWIHKT